MKGVAAEDLLPGERAAIAEAHALIYQLLQGTEPAHRFSAEQTDEAPQLSCRVPRQHRAFSDKLCRDDQVLLIHYGAALAGIVFLFQMVSAGAGTAAGLARGASFRAWFKPTLAFDEELTEEGRAAQRRFWVAFAKLIVAGIVFVLT